MRNIGKMTLETVGNRELLLRRDFRAPKNLVYRTMTEPDLLVRWFDGPPGWKLVECSIDLRVDGRYRYVWTGPENDSMGLGGVYLEIVTNEMIRATELFDESWYPGDAIDTTTLSENEGVTTLSLSVVYHLKLWKRCSKRLWKKVWPEVMTN